MDYLVPTQNYYAQWLSVEPDLLNRNGKFFLYSTERDCVQNGYSKPIDFYGFLSNQTTVITYGRKLEPHIAWIQDFFQNSGDIITFKQFVKDKLGQHVQQDYKYYFTQLPPNIDISKASQLTEQDYPAYLRFFEKQYPDSEVQTWLGDYYKEIAAKGYIFGYFINNELISATDAPDMPYMKASAVELGVNTLLDYRGKGYARIVMAAMLNFVLRQQKVPIVSCTSLNIASQKLLQSIGFIKFADTIWFSL